MPVPLPSTRSTGPAVWPYPAYVQPARIELAVTTTATAIAWETLLQPGRDLLYRALAVHAPTLGAELHERGLGPHRMVPFGFCPPTFPTTRRNANQWMTSGTGTLAFTTPHLEVATALTQFLTTAETLHWGSTPLTVKSATVRTAPDHSCGAAEFVTTLPTLAKNRSGRFVLPDAPEFMPLLTANLEKKAKTLGVPAPDSVTLNWMGRQRLFRVARSARIGAPIAVRVKAAPETLDVIWAWGLGALNSQGFGFIQ